MLAYKHDRTFDISYKKVRIVCGIFNRAPLLCVLILYELNYCKLFALFVY